MNVIKKKLCGGVFRLNSNGLIERLYILIFSNKIVGVVWFFEGYILYFVEIIVVVVVVVYYIEFYMLIVLGMRLFGLFV